MHSEKKRIFIALPLPEEFKKQVSLAINGYRNQFPDFRWLEENKWHLTVFPPHYWDDKEINLAIKLLSQDLKIKPFNLETEQIILGPPGKEKRMAWLVFKQQQEFLNLKKETENILTKAGLPIDGFRQKEIIHLTLARFKDANFSGFQENCLRLEVSCSMIELWRVFLNTGGALYQSLASFKLL